MKLRWNLAQALEKYWWSWYLSGKDPASYLQWKQHYWADFFQRFNLPLAPRGKLLEVGSGPAGAFIILPKENLTILDPLLSVYRRKYSNLMEPFVSQVQAICLPLEEWNPSEHYDHIFCFNVINHTARLELCIDTLIKAMNSGARLYLSVDCHRFRVLNWLFRLLPGDLLHPQQLSVQAYLERFCNAGLKLLHTECIRREPIFDYQLFIFEK